MRCFIGMHQGGQHHGQRQGGQQRVDPVEHAAVARQQVAGILDAGAALDQRFDQVADDAHRGQEHGGDHQQPPARARPAACRGWARRPARRRSARSRRRPAPARRPCRPRRPSQLLPGLIAGASLLLVNLRPKARPAEVGDDVGHPDQHQHRQQEVDADHPGLGHRQPGQPQGQHADRPARTARGMCGQPATPARSSQAPASTQSAPATDHSTRQRPLEQAQPTRTPRTAARQATAAATEPRLAQPVQAAPLPARAAAISTSVTTAKGTGDGRTAPAAGWPAGRRR